MMHYTRNYDLKAKIFTGDLDLIVKKQRNGGEGRLQLAFHAPTGKFFAR
jgi:replicative DNA helicase